MDSEQFILPENTLDVSVEPSEFLTVLSEFLTVLYVYLHHLVFVHPLSRLQLALLVGSDSEQIKGPSTMFSQSPIQGGVVCLI